MSQLSQHNANKRRFEAMNPEEHKAYNENNA